MSQVELNQLERDVETARKRFGRHLERLRSPETLSQFKEDVTADVQGLRNEITLNAKAAASNTIANFIDDIKERAAANPTAALAIGAGVAWRLATHPPIASILVGYGVFSLMRTPQHMPQSDIVTRAEDMVTRAEELATAMKHKVEQWSTDAPDTGEFVDSLKDSLAQLSTMAEQTAMQFADAAKTAAVRGSETVSHALQNSSETLGHALQSGSDALGHALRTGTDTVTHAVRSGSDTIGRALPGGEERDKYLLGVAALALAGAVGIAYQRRAM
jgi:methyl-accepting chemotaxis protein